MKVADLKVGELYKIRSDRETHVIVRRGVLDVHLGGGIFKDKSKIRPFSHLLYLGKGGKSPCNGGRWVSYRGTKLCVYPNVWQHIVPLEES